MRSVIPCIAIVFLLMSGGYDLHAQTSGLREEIARTAATLSGDVGVAIMNLSTGDTLTLRGRDHFPMQSVFKFPLAVMVLREVDRGALTLDKKIHIKKEDLLLNTWSPLAEKYPEGNVDVTLAELLNYTVSQSDNSGCDILFRLVGGPLKVNDFIHQLGITQIAIVATEKEMHQAWPVQFTNWCEPGAMTELLRKFDRGKILSASSHDFLWKLMVETPRGSGRIKGLLPTGTVVAHKTGLGGFNTEGVLGAMNDVGIMVLPDGTRVAVVIYISRSAKKDMDKLEPAMAQISRAVYDHYVHPKN